MASMLIHIMFLCFFSPSFGESTSTTPTEPTEDEASLLRINTMAVEHQLARKTDEKTIYEEGSEELDDSRQGDIHEAGEKTLDDEAEVEDSREVDDSRQDEIDEAGEQDQQLERVEQEALEQAEQDAKESQSQLADIFTDVMKIGREVWKNMQASSKQYVMKIRRDAEQIGRDVREIA
eukprot:gnl/TRDRNA2_/TRDRNA2_131199_c0_seq3.p1 gnl/TRDRNA2_/TRDRNA2_131199_c0~~gnl/TRDRNA2_/TRDRNA2_131199_c0_seq3.p1  ORF type:complete len:178 (-),score=32.47 gnl/TRDRNA2_/TRDRNA2_131199_c0_seq3:182-715(-)